MPLRSQALLVPHPASDSQSYRLPAVWVLVVALLLGSSAGAFGPVAAFAATFQGPGGVNLSGQWSSDWGSVLLEHTPSGVAGTMLQPGRVGACPASSPGCLRQITSGTFDPGSRVLTIAYYQSWNNITGSATFQLSVDGNTLTGQFDQPGSTDTWTMRRQG
jgi:hypothetical protein